MFEKEAREKYGIKSSTDIVDSIKANFKKHQVSPKIQRSFWRAYYAQRRMLEDDSKNS